MIFKYFKKKKEDYDDDVFTKLLMPTIDKHAPVRKSVKNIIAP